MAHAGRVLAAGPDSDRAAALPPDHHVFALRSASLRQPVVCDLCLWPAPWPESAGADDRMKPLDTLWQPCLTTPDRLIVRSYETGLLATLIRTGGDEWHGLNDEQRSQLAHRLIFVRFLVDDGRLGEV